jgi:CelD/BcsL family acetyltransferase involved in cellulose biosynthesis
MKRTSSDHETEIVSDIKRWDAVASEWDALFERCSHAAVPMTSTWMRTWWDVYGSTYAANGESLRILCVRRDGELIGVLPLYLRRMIGMPGARSLYLLSSGEAEIEETSAEYLDMLCRPEDRAQCVTAVADALSGLAWDRIVLRLLPASSPLRELGETTLPGEVTVVDSSVCPIADLEGGFEAYLQRLSSKTRYRMRRCLREADSGNVAFRVADDSTRESMFEDLRMLHQQHWEERGKPGCFSAERFVEFHRRLIRLWGSGGQALLAGVYASDGPLAMLYGFVKHGEYHSYQAGLRRESVPGVHSPGVFANLMLMQYLCDRGVGVFDFLGGRSHYKLQLSTTQKSMVHVIVWRHGLRARLMRYVEPIRQRLGFA